MKILIALLLGLVQGLCEFLPVSSSGHLYLVEKLTGGAVGEGYFGSFFVVMLHVATLIAVLFVYREQVGAILARGEVPLMVVLTARPPPEM